MASRFERFPPRERGQPGSSRAGPGPPRTGPSGRIRLPAAAGLIVALCLSVSAVRANSVGRVRLRFLNVWPRQTGATYLSDAYYGSFYTGTYNLELDPTVKEGLEGPDLVDSAAPFDYKIGSYCADLLQYAPGSYEYYDIYRPAEAPIGGGNTPMGDDKALDLRRLFDRHLHKVVDHNTAAAFQACVWEIVYEDPSNSYDASYYNAGTRGEFYVQESWGGPSWTYTANSWLGDLGEDDPDIGLRVLANTSLQDFAVTIPGLGAEPIPEPLTVMGVFLGVAAGAGYVRRRRLT